jgi:hypothetical protein
MGMLHKVYTTIYTIQPLIATFLATKVGLLPRHSSEEQISHVYGYFKSPSSGNEILVSGFKVVHCCSVAIDFVGVW